MDVAAWPVVRAGNGRGLDPGGARGCPAASNPRAMLCILRPTVALPAAIVILGLPGAGKTRLACGLAATLLDRDEATLVVHTDVLKVTARELDIGAREALRGPGFAGDVMAKAARMHAMLATHVVKARRDGYSVVIEGTLALGFRAEDAVYVLLEVDEAERRRRVGRKHESAVRTLADCDLAPYAAALVQSLPPSTLRLDAALPPGTLVSRALDWIRESWHYAA